MQIFIHHFSGKLTNVSHFNLAWSTQAHKHTRAYFCSSMHSELSTALPINLARYRAINYSHTLKNGGMCGHCNHVLSALQPYAIATYNRNESNNHIKISLK